MNWKKYPDLDWALASGSHIRQILGTTYWEDHGYWRYLNELVAFLRSKNVSQIQQKIRDANDLPKFHSIVSELDFARVFAERGKAVTLLPDNFLGKTPSPDMLVKDEKGEAFVEVKRLTEDDSEHLIVDFLRDFLNDPNKKYRVDITLSRELSVPLTSGKERGRKENIMHKIVSEFPTIFESTRRGTLPIRFEIEGVEFELHPSNLDKGYPGFIHTDAFVFPSELWAQKLAGDICEKARKRDKWTGQALKKFYFVAFDCKEAYLDEDEVGFAVIGWRVTYQEGLSLPRIELDQLVESAQTKGWERFLKKECIIPSGRTFLDPSRKGVFFTRQETRNVSAVMVKFPDSLYLLPNPFAQIEINDPELETYFD